MKIKNLQQMKKALLGVIAVAIVALAAFNLNLIHNNEAKVSVDLSNPVSLAQGESGDGSGEGICLQYINHSYLWDCWYWVLYACHKGGDEINCESGDFYYEMCPPFGYIDEVEGRYCPKP